MIEPELVPFSAAADTKRTRLRIPGWLSLLLANPKSRFGLVVLAFMILVALIAPWISVDNPTDFNILATRQAPSWHHLFGTTDQGSDIFSQVVLGTRRSLILGASAARDPRCVRRRDRRRGRQLPDERLPRHPHDPALDRDLRVPEGARDDDDDPRPRPDAVGVRGAHPARPGAVAEEP
jgi:hypothetical protein